MAAWKAVLIFEVSEDPSDVCIVIDTIGGRYLMGTLDRSHMAALHMLCLITLFIGLSAAGEHFGSLILCPPGGQSFATAYMMACEMKRRRRKREFGSMRPATLKDIQNICCEVGCELRDLLDYCDPFGDFNS